MRRDRPNFARIVLLFFIFVLSLGCCSSFDADFGSFARFFLQLLRRGCPNFAKICKLQNCFHFASSQFSPSPCCILAAVAVTMEDIRKHMVLDAKPTRATLVDIKNVFESHTHKVKMVKKAEVLAPITEDGLTNEMHYLAFRIDGDSSLEKLLGDKINKLAQRIERLEEENHELKAIKFALYMHDSLLYLNSRLSFLLRKELLSSTLSHTWFGEGRPFKKTEEDIDFGHVLFFLNKSGMIAFPEIRRVILRCCNKLIAEYHDGEGHINNHINGEWFLNTFAEARFMGKPFRIDEGHKFCVYFEPPRALNQPLVLCKNVQPEDPLRVYNVLVAAKDTKKMIESSFNVFSYVFQLKEGVAAEDQHKALQTVLHVALVMIIKDLECWILQQRESFVKCVETYKNGDLLYAANEPLIVSNTQVKLNCPRLGGIPIIQHRDFDEGQFSKGDSLSWLLARNPQNCDVPSLTSDLLATSGNYQPKIWGYGQEAAWLSRDAGNYYGSTLHDDSETLVDEPRPPGT